MEATRNYVTINDMNINIIKDKSALLNRCIIKVHNECTKINLLEGDAKKRKIAVLIKQILCLDGVSIDPDIKDLARNVSSISLFRKCITRGTALLLAKVIYDLTHADNADVEVIDTDELWAFINFNLNLDDDANAIERQHIEAIKGTVNGYVGGMKINREKNVIEFDHKWRLSSWFGHSLYKLSMVRNTSDPVEGNIINDTNDHKIAASIGILDYDAQFSLLHGFVNAEQPINDQINKTKLLRRIAVSLEIPINRAEELLTNPIELIRFINAEVGAEVDNNVSKKFPSSIGFKLFHYINRNADVNPDENINHDEDPKTLLIKLISNGKFKNNIAVLDTIYKNADNELKREIYVGVMKQIKYDMFDAESITKIVGIIKEEPLKLKQTFLELLQYYSELAVQEPDRNYSKGLERFIINSLNLLKDNDINFDNGEQQKIGGYIRELISNNYLDAYSAMHIFNGLDKNYVELKKQTFMTLLQYYSEVALQEPNSDQGLRLFILNALKNDSIIIKHREQEIGGYLRELISKKHLDLDDVMHIFKELDKNYFALKKQTFLELLRYYSELAVQEQPNSFDSRRSSKRLQIFILDSLKLLKDDKNITDKEQQEIGGYLKQLVVNKHINLGDAMPIFDKLLDKLIEKGSSEIICNIKSSFIGWIDLAKPVEEPIFQLIERLIINSDPAGRGADMPLATMLLGSIVSEDNHNGDVKVKITSGNLNSLVIILFSNMVERGLPTDDKILQQYKEFLGRLTKKLELGANVLDSTGMLLELNKEAYEAIMRLLMSDENLWDGNIVPFELMLRGSAIVRNSEYKDNLKKLIKDNLNTPQYSQTFKVITNRIIKDDVLLKAVDKNSLLMLIKEFSDQLDPESVKYMLCNNSLDISYSEVLDIFDKYYNLQKNPGSLIKAMIESGHHLLEFNEFNDNDFNFELLCQSILKGKASINKINKDYNLNYKLSYELIGSLIHNMDDKETTQRQKLEELKNFCQAMRELHSTSDGLVGIVSEIGNMDISNHEEMISKLNNVKSKLNSMRLNALMPN